MKKTIALIMLILAVATACVTTSKPTNPLPPTPPAPIVGKTLSPEEIGKKHNTISVGLDNINSNVLSSEKMAELIKSIAKVTVPENFDIPLQADGIISNSEKTFEIVAILMRENSELRTSSLIASDSIVRLKEDCTYVRSLLDQSKLIYDDNVKAIQQIKTVDIEEYKKKKDKEYEEATLTIKKLANEQIDAANSERDIYKSKNAELDLRVGGLQKLIEGTLGKVFIPFIALGALLLAAGIGSFFGLFELAGRKAFGLMAAGATMVTVGTIMPIVVNSTARALDPTVTMIMKISLWIAFAGFFAYVGWLLWNRIKGMKTEKELIQTVAVYKGCVEEKISALEDGDNMMTGLKDRINLIQSPDTQNVVKRVRLAIRDKIGENVPDIPNWMMIILFILFGLVNGSLIWFASTIA